MRKYLLLFSLCLVLGTYHTAWAAKARIVDFTVTRGKEYIYIDARLEGAFTDEINEAIVSGIPTTFKYFLELVKPRLLWFDKKPVKRLIQHRVEYDVLKKEYRITLDDGISPQVKVTQSEEEMRKTMAGINSFRFLSVSELPPAGNYQVRLKAEMKGIKWPFPLNYLFSYFISFLDFDTPWVTSPIPAVSSKTSQRINQVIESQ